MMKSISNVSRATVLLAVASAALGGCQLDGDGGARAYDGETLYRGIVLGQGEVASLIPEIRDSYALDHMVMAKAERQAAVAARDAIAAAIAAAHPDFFERFAASMQSGDHVQIRRGLADAGPLTLEAMEQLGLVPDPATSGRHKCLLGPCGLEVIVLLVIERPANVRTPGDESQLAQDRLVDSIALRLAP